MAIEAPLIDQRDQEKLIEQLNRLLSFYCPELKINQVSDGQLSALVAIYARMMEIIIQRLNKAPDKNFLSFLDLVGIRLASPQVAKVPLTFAMAMGANQYGYIPKGTQVATAPQKDGTSIVFETEKDVTIILPKMIKAVSIDPTQDEWTDHSEGFFGQNLSRPTQTLFTGESLIPHRLYFGHAQLFSLKEKSTIVLQLIFKNSNLYDASDIKWYYFSGKPAEPVEITNITWEILKNPNKSIVTRTLQVIFPDVAEIAEQTFTQTNTGKDSSVWTNHWIVAELKTPVPQRNLPEIVSASASIKINQKTISSFDSAYFNNFKLDLTKDFYIFGEKPKFNDTFYLASQEAFSKKDATISISFTLSAGIPVPDTTKVTLGWEFWNGKSWKTIGITNQSGVDPDSSDYQFKDTTNAFTNKEKTGTISFHCPAIVPTTIHEVENYWIRVRIIDGNYGEEAKYEKNKPDREERVLWDYIKATYLSPSIANCTLTYDFVPPAETLQVLTFNDFVFTEQAVYQPASNHSFIPFKPVDDQQSTLYLGYDNSIAELPITLFFPLIRNVFSINEDGGDLKAPVVIWEYWNGNQWAMLHIEDGTENFLKREMIQFWAPGDIASLILFETNLYWIRARLAGSKQWAPKLTTIYSNTIWASHQLTVKDEILGSSNGNPDQTVKFANIPVLPGQQIWVRETALTEADKERVTQEEGNDAVFEVPDQAGNIVELWVRWHEVKYFHFSETNSRHYCLDRNTGTVYFGDGKRGMIPPAGKDNIKCSFYQSGGGAKGNVAAGTLVKLRTTFPYIDSVTNPEAADGGFDQEDLERAKIRGPQTIKHRERAVTFEDFEWLVREASLKVAKVKCLPNTNPAQRYKPGWITIIVVPESDDLKPLPSQELLSEIENYILARATSFLTKTLTSTIPYPQQINLINPGYLKVGATAVVKYTSLSMAKITESKIIDNLKSYFHPLHGGMAGQGWDFGRNVYISDVYHVIENTKGVDYIQDLYLRAQVQLYTLTMKDQEDHKPICSHSYPRLSYVRSLDQKTVFLLAEALSADANVSRLKIIGFKEDDQINLYYNKQQYISLAVKSVIHESLGDTLVCEPIQTDFAIPLLSVVATKDHQVKSFIMNQIPAKGIITELKVAIFEPDEQIMLGQEYQKNEIIIPKIQTIDEHQDTIYIDSNYLVYAGDFRVYAEEDSMNRRDSDQPVFRYLINRNTKEIHDIMTAPCKLAAIHKENRWFTKEIPKDLIVQKRLDYCDYCFNPKPSIP